MHVLVAKTASYVDAGGTKVDVAVTGFDPVIPWYPFPAAQVFLGTKSMATCKLAVVVDYPELDADVMVAALNKEFPGIPEYLHEFAVIKAVLAARTIPVGTTVRVYMVDGVVKIQDYDFTNNVTVWDNLPPPPVAGPQPSKHG